MEVIKANKEFIKSIAEDEVISVVLIIGTSIVLIVNVIIPSVVIRALFTLTLIGLLVIIYYLKKPKILESIRVKDLAEENDSEDEGKINI